MRSDSERQAIKAKAASQALVANHRYVNVSISALRPDDVDTADRVMRTAFGTFLGAPEPMLVFGDAECVRPRFAAAPAWAFAAKSNGEVIGSNLVARWGSFGFLGPLTVRPDFWDRGVASALLEPAMKLFDQWGLRQAALFTFADSPKHIGLYQKFGFWPQYLTALMRKPIASQTQATFATYSAAPPGERESLENACRQVTDAIFAGLDVTHEIRFTDAQKLGDTVLLYDDSELTGFAVCHCGAGEAGSGTCYVKFGAVRSDRDAEERFARLLDACEALGRRHGVEHILAGVNTARSGAYRRMLAHGYRARSMGVIMQKPNEPGYCRSEVYAIDDLR